MKKPELLSPVGNMESLYAAIYGGCDAVYLSGYKYGARAFAGNFKDEELIEVIKICHLYGIKVYVTVNTIVYEHEVDGFVNYVDFLHRNNVDALIIQDIGMMDLIRKLYPNLELHASTQMHIHNLEGVKLLQSLGLKRVVLARETPIKLIEEIKNKTNIDLEIFVHGALCVSYSGQCLMSGLIGNRSGNRGTCAQCCRQKYSLIVDKKRQIDNQYILSTKDLCTLNNIDKLIDIGVDSLKIEGRMKRPEYVYLVTSIYRKYIDKYIETGILKIEDNDIKELKKIFNRNFTKGFMFGEKNDNFTNIFRPNHCGIEIGKVIDYKNNYVYIKLFDELNMHDGIRFVSDDIGMTITNLNISGKIAKIKCNEKITIGTKVVKTTDSKQIKNIQELLKKEKKILIDIDIKVICGKNIFLQLSDGINKVITKSEYIVQKAINNSTDSDRIIRQIGKLGDSIYQIREIKTKIDDNVFVPIQILNNLRRTAIEELNQKRMYKIIYEKRNYTIELKNYKKVQKKSILTNQKEIGYDEIYLEYEKEGTTLKIPRVSETFMDYNNRVLVGDLGGIYKYSNVVTDFSLNVVNSYSVAFLHSIGVDKITLSYELTDKQIKNLVDAYHKRYQKHPNLELIINGYEEVMVCKYKLPNNSYLQDRFGNNYKIKIKNNLMYIYNYKKRLLNNNYYNIGINWLRINDDI